MRTNKIKTAIFSVTILAFAGISAFAQRDEISTTKWTLTQAYGNSALNSAAFFEINIGRTRFMGNTGCNQMFGVVDVNGNRINFSGVGMTKRMCKMLPGSIPEATFIKALEETVRYRQNGGGLDLYNRRGRVTLKFKVPGKQDPIEDADSAKRLEDGKWMLESIGNRQTLVAIDNAFIIFDPRKRSAGGNSGCNSFGGKYSSRGKTLAVTGIIQTMRACEEDGKMLVEREFLAGLQNANRYEIKASRLHLYRGRQLLLTFRGENK